MSNDNIIKLIIFDMDGVLVDARELHYEALNRSLETVDKKYTIERSEHLSTFEIIKNTRVSNLCGI